MKVFIARGSAVLIILLILLFSAEMFLRNQNFVQLDGFSTNNPWNNTLHHGSDEFVVTNFGSSCNGKKLKMLLLGDSWMEDETFSRTIGEVFAAKSGVCVQTVNGGNSSYSPTLYLLRARDAFDEFGRFDYIVVNIDETDVGDEWLRYRIPLHRNQKGEIVAVPFNRDIASKYLWNGKLWAEDSRLYLIRLVKFAFFYKVLVPMHHKFITSASFYSNLMQYLFAPDADLIYKNEHRYFEERLYEMIDNLSQFVTDPSSIFVTHHPHLRGVLKNVNEGRLYLPVVSDAIRRLSHKTGVNVLDAREHIMQIHGEDLLKNTYLEGDMFSHLRTEGAIRYGKWIGEHIELKHDKDQI